MNKWHLPIVYKRIVLDEQFSFHKINHSYAKKRPLLKQENKSPTKIKSCPWHSLNVSFREENANTETYKSIWGELHIIKFVLEPGGVQGKQTAGMFKKNLNRKYYTWEQNSPFLLRKPINTHKLSFLGFQQCFFHISPTATPKSNQSAWQLRWQQVQFATLPVHPWMLFKPKRVTFVVGGARVKGESFLFTHEETSLLSIFGIFHGKASQCVCARFSPITVKVAAVSFS